MSEKTRYITIDGEQIAVTEEVYRAYKRPLWSDRKRRERAGRCRSSEGRRCTKDCRLCPESRDGNALSLDRLIEDGLEPADPFDMTEAVEENQLREQLRSAIRSLSAQERELLDDLFYAGMTEREVAAKLNLSQKTVNKRRHKVIEKLRTILSEQQNL